MGYVYYTTTQGPFQHDLGVDRGFLFPVYVCWVAVGGGRARVDFVRARSHISILIATPRICIKNNQQPEMAEEEDPGAVEH